MSLYDVLLLGVTRNRWDKGMDLGDSEYIAGLHFFEVESADDVRGKKAAKDRYFTSEAEAQAYFQEVQREQPFVWLSEIGDCYKYQSKWRVFDWSPAVAADELYPYPPRGRGNGYVAESHNEVDRKQRLLPRRYTPHDPTYVA